MRFNKILTLNIWKSANDRSGHLAAKIWQYHGFGRICHLDENNRYVKIMLKRLTINRNVYTVYICIVYLYCNVWDG